MSLAPKSAHNEWKALDQRRALAFPSTGFVWPMIPVVSRGVVCVSYCNDTRSVAPCDYMSC